MKSENKRRKGIVIKRKQSKEKKQAEKDKSK
jgi:hypothetical protein